jgi:hypothetical protein
MSDWVFIIIVLSYTLLGYFFTWAERLHKQEIERLHESYKEERQELLDRIMANNIHEFKSVNGSPGKRSETGNYLKDRMATQIMKQFDME